MVNFDSIAPIYNSLVGWTFGDALERAKQNNLTFLEPHHTNILILGSGTGKILPHIHRYNPNLQIVCIETSEAMIMQTKKYLNQQGINLHITYIKNFDLEILKSQYFDVIVTNFFLDMFEDKYLLKLVQTLSYQLKQKGYWFFTDFDPLRKFLWQRILIKLMYLFFTICCKVKIKSLPNFKKAFYLAKLQPIYQEYSYSKMIRSTVYSHLKQKKSMF